MFAALEERPPSPKDDFTFKDRSKIVFRPDGRTVSWLSSELGYSPSDVEKAIKLSCGEIDAAVSWLLDNATLMKKEVI